MSPRRKKLSLTTAAVLIGWLLTMLTAVWAVSAASTGAEKKLEATAERTQDHEARLRLIEAQVTTVATDVRWIRDSLARVETKLNQPGFQPMCDAIDIAEAIKTELNAGEFSQAFEAVRGYIPVFDLEDMDDKLHVTVVPAGDTQANLARKLDTFSFITELGVLRRFPGEGIPNNEMLDPMMDLVQEIRLFFRKRRLTEFHGAICTTVEATYSDDHLERLNQFSALIKFRHTLIR